MTDDFIREKVKEYFKHHGLDTSPCRRCKNLSFKRPAGKIKCLQLPRDEWQKHYQPNAPDCDRFEKGDFQLRD